MAHRSRIPWGSGLGVSPTVARHPRATGAHCVGLSASARAPRPRMSSLRYELPRCHSTALMVTNSSLAISRLVRPWAASSATRRSLGVSSSVPLRPDGARPPARWSSSRARRAARRAPICSAIASASRRVSRASVGRPARRIAPPSSTSAYARSTRAPQPRSSLAADGEPCFDLRPALKECGGPGGDPERARRAEPLGQREFAIDQLARPLRPAEPERGDPSLRTPVEHRRVERQN